MLTENNKASARSTSNSRWRVIVDVSNVLIAICAVATLLLIWRDNDRMANTLDAARDAFSAQAFPVVKFSHYQFYMPSTPSKGECDPSANGLNVYVRNFSGVPVVLTLFDVEFRMGQRPMFVQEAERSVGNAGDVVLAPGEIMGRGRLDKTFPDFYKRLRGTGIATFMNFDVKVEYASLSSGKRYSSTETITMLDDCRFPTQRNFTRDKATIVELKEPTT